MASRVVGKWHCPFENCPKHTGKPLKNAAGWRIHLGQSHGAKLPSGQDISGMDTSEIVQLLESQVEHPTSNIVLETIEEVVRAKGKASGSEIIAALREKTAVDGSNGELRNMISQAAAALKPNIVKTGRATWEWRGGSSPEANEPEPEPEVDSVEYLAAERDRHFRRRTKMIKNIRQLLDVFVDDEDKPSETRDRQLLTAERNRYRHQASLLQDIARGLIVSNPENEE